MLPIASSHKSRCGDVAPSRRSKWRATVLVLVHLAIIAHVLHWQFAGKTLTPLEPSESMQTLELGLVNAGFVLFVIATIATLIFGRFFCGWACHVVAYQDLCAWLLGKVGLRPRPIRSRLLVLVPLGAAFYMFAWPTILRLDAGGSMPAFVAHFTTDDLWRTFPSPWMGALTLLVCGFVVVWFFGAKGFCTYGCPYGAVFGIADRAAPVRIRVTDACEGCGHCTAVCTSNVRVHQEVALHRMVVDPGCMKCLDCVSVCPKDALYVGKGIPALAAPNATKKRVYDFTWFEEALAAVWFVAALYAFRELYHKVPFLLAIGGATCVALAAVVTFRTFARRDFTFQHVVARREGRFTRNGAALLASTIALLAFTAHSALVQYHTHEGVRRMAELRAAGTTVDPTRYEFALESFAKADSLGLFPDGHVDLAISSLADRLGKRDLALDRARAAIEHEPRLTQAYLQLADLLRRDGKLEDAEQVLMRLRAR